MTLNGNLKCLCINTDKPHSDVMIICHLGSSLNYSFLIKT